MFNHHLKENDLKKPSNQTVNIADSVFTCIMETGSTKRSKHRLHSFRDCFHRKAASVGVLQVKRMLTS